MNQEAGRNAISNGRKNEEKSRNHSEESIRPARYAKAICSDPDKRCAKVNIDLKLLPGGGHERSVKPRFAAISGVAMNDPALGRLVDC